MDARVVLKLPPLPDGIPEAPSAEEAGESAQLLEFVAVRCPTIEAQDGQDQKDALAKLCALFGGWCPTPFHVFVSGSYRMGVHSREADIDVLFVTTEAVRREDVFGAFMGVLQACEEVSELQPVPKARVPIIGLKLMGQDFDVLTCHLRVSTLPSKYALLQSYEWMNHMDPECVLAFNGPRVTEMILASLTRPNQFCNALRVLRHWAKQRFVYSNKSGYLGGVNLALMLLYVAQRHPDALSARLVREFFVAFSTWKWGAARPMGLDAHVPHTCPVWLQTLEWTPRLPEAMVVLTPCFPRFNTAFSASKYSCAVMQREMARARDLLGATFDLATVCAPLDCFLTCTRFIKVSVQAPHTPSGASWQGFMEAQTRYLVQYLANEELAVKEFRYIPQWHTHVQDNLRLCDAFITADDDGKARSYKVRGTLDTPLRYFLTTFADNGPPRPPGATVHLSFCARTSLPASLCGLPASANSTAQLLALVVSEPAAQAPRAARKVMCIRDLAARRVRPPPPPSLPRKFTISMKPEPPAPTRVVRILLTPAGPVEPWDVYISGACVFRRGRVPGSPFAVPDRCRRSTAEETAAEFEAYARARAGADVQWRRQVRGLRGKRLGCWCVPGSEWCHGRVLARLAWEPGFHTEQAQEGTGSKQPTRSRSRHGRR